MNIPTIMPRLEGFCFPREMIAYAVWAYHRFALSTADVEDLLAARGVLVSREAVRLWVNRFGHGFADCIRRDRPPPNDKWDMDEAVIMIRGRKHWLWRAIAANGDVLDILVQTGRRAKAAKRFFKRLVAKFGAASEVIPKFTAHADPASQWSAAGKGPAFFAYSDNYLIDTDHGTIMDVDASRLIRQAELGAMRKMIDRTEARFGIKPDWIAADTAYGSSENLVWLTLKRQILPFIPVFDSSKRKDGPWFRADFTWDEDKERYICPEGKELRHTRRNYSDPARNAPGLKA